MAQIKDIAIYGTGGFGREVACLIRLINEQEPRWNMVGFFNDDPAMQGQMVSHFGPCLGGIEVLNAWDKELAVAIAIGDCHGRKSVFDKIANPNIWFPNVVHPHRALLDYKSFSIGVGNIIQGGCSASCDVHIGDFNVLNGSVFLGHDDTIGSFNSFMPYTKISGNVTIGQCNYFGVGSVVIEQLSIGNNIRLGAGSALMTPPKDDSLYLGVPAKQTEF